MAQPGVAGWVLSGSYAASLFAKAATTPFHENARPRKRLYDNSPVSAKEGKAGKRPGPWRSLPVTTVECPYTRYTSTNNNQYQQVFTRKNMRQNTAWFRAMCQYQRRKEQ